MPRGHPHLVWDWNGTILDDLAAVVAATNEALRLVGGPSITADDHRRDFRRPVIDYYRYVLGREVATDEFHHLDRVFHEAYLRLLPTCALVVDAGRALRAWPGTQSLLSMWFHDDLVPAVTGYRLAGHFARVDGLRATRGGGMKAPHLVAHLAALGVAGPDCVLIGDSLDDAAAAAEVGARCVLFAGGFTDEPRLRATGLPLAGTLLEAVQLAGAFAVSPP